MNLSSKKFSEVKQTIQTSARLLKIIWQIDKGLLIGSTITVMIPAILPFVNFYIYKLVIDTVVASVQGQAFNYFYLYQLLALRIFTYFLQGVVFGAQEYLERMLWSKVPIDLDQMILGKISSLVIQYFENSKFTDLLEKVRQNYT